MARGSVRPPGPAPSRNDASKARRPQETFGPCRPSSRRRMPGAVGGRRDPSPPDADDDAARCPATIRPMEIMGIRIPTIVKDNVALRCDGCLEVIEGTPWRLNILDIVAAETPVSWAGRAGHQPGPLPVPRRPVPRPCLDGRARLALLPPRPGPRDHATDPDPRRRAALGPVRRDPSRRPRVHPGLTVRRPRAVAGGGPGTHRSRPRESPVDSAGRRAYPPPVRVPDRYLELPRIPAP